MKGEFFDIPEDKPAENPEELQEAERLEIENALRTLAALERVTAAARRSLTATAPAQQTTVSSEQSPVREMTQAWQMPPHPKPGQTVKGRFQEVVA